MEVPTGDCLPQTARSVGIVLLIPIKPLLGFSALKLDQNVPKVVLSFQLFPYIGKIIIVINWLQIFHLLQYRWYNFPKMCYNWAQQKTGYLICKGRRQTVNNGIKTWRIILMTENLKILSVELFHIISFSSLKPENTFILTSNSKEVRILPET